MLVPAFCYTINVFLFYGFSSNDLIILWEASSPSTRMLLLWSATGCYYINFFRTFIPGLLLQVFDEPCNIFSLPLLKPWSCFRNFSSFWSIWIFLPRFWLPVLCLTLWPGSIELAWVRSIELCLMWDCFRSFLKLALGTFTKLFTTPGTIF